MPKPKNIRYFFCTLAVLLGVRTPLHASSEHYNVRQAILTRNYMAHERFFNRLTPTFETLQLTIPYQIKAQKSNTRQELNGIFREYPRSRATTYALVTAVPVLFLFASRHTLSSWISDISTASPDSIAQQYFYIALTISYGIYHIFYPALNQFYYSAITAYLPENDLILQYGSKKHLLSTSLQAFIENTIIYPHWEAPVDISLERIQKILNKALRLPIMTKELHYDHEKVTVALKHYPQEVKKRLDRFAHAEILYQNMTPPPSHRFPIYLQGAPGTGKTFAASQLAKTMGTTLATVSLDGATIDDIVGTPFENADAKSGRLLDAIIANTHSTHDINHKNQILIIDEFDRLLTSEDKQSKDLLSFMLKLLDPTTRHFYSPYLRTSINLPDTIILAGNQDISELTKQSPRLEALDSRLETIRFPGFDDEAKFNIAIESIIPRLEKSYQSLNSFFDDFTLPEEDLDRLKAFIVSDEDPGLRSMEKFIFILFEEHLNEHKS